MENQRTQSDMLKSYCDQMHDLILEEGIRKPWDKRTSHQHSDEKHDDVRLFERVHTLTILKGCDANRKRVIVQFLYEACLIQKESPVVNLSYADLRAANLRNIPLTEGSSSGQENASLYARGVTKGSASPLRAKLSWRSSVFSVRRAWAHGSSGVVSDATAFARSLCVSIAEDEPHRVGYLHLFFPHVNAQES
jgi:hypothetical protein